MIDESVPIFSYDCPEPKGIVRRYVYPMCFTMDNLRRFWEHASKFRVLFSEEVKDFHTFCEYFMSMEGETLSAHGLFWRVDDFVGVYYMTHIEKNDALIHYSFFDRRHRGRQELTRMMIRYVFDKYGFRRLSAAIPHFANTENEKTLGAFQFIRQVGLKQEGIKRKAIMFNGDWFNVANFGVLKEEAEAWS